MKQSDRYNKNKSMYLLSVLPLLFTVNIHAADEQTITGSSVDTSEWKCKFCPVDEGFSGEVELGLGNVSEDSFKFGEYNGLYEQGGFLLLNAETRYRGEDATYLDVSGTDLGLDTREVNIDGGVQGKYSLFLNYDEIPHYISDSAASPFLGAGSDSQPLPPGWVRAGTTGAMSSLPASEQPVDLYTQRKRLAVGASLVQGPHWIYDMQVRHETKDGKLGTAGTFYFKSAELVMPVDYVTDQVDVSTAYTGRKWQAKLAYYGSTFTDNNKFLNWQNPYTPLVAGADSAMLATPPDNQFHQVVISAGTQLTQNTRATGELAYGRMEQDDPFVPSTLNTGLGAPALPRTSLGGRVDTLNANLKLHSSVTESLRLDASIVYSDRDNKTPQAIYDWVTTDSFLAAPRTNQPYSFQHNTADIKAAYRYSQAVKLSAGLNQDVIKRTYQEVQRTTENSAWAELKVRTKAQSDIALKYTYADRDASDYTAVPEIDGPENPLMRKYNMADRRGDRIKLSGSMMLTEKAQVSAGIDYGKDDYTNSELGLTGSDTLTLNADFSYAMSESTSLYVFLNQENINSEIAGSESFSAPDWVGKNSDTINTAGMGVKQNIIEDKLDAGLDLVLTRSTGEVDVSNSAPFPDLHTRLDSLKIYADYRMKDNITLSAAFWHENYDSDDWTLDGVTPTTLSDVLGFGETSPSYNVNAITVSMRYKF